MSSTAEQSWTYIDKAGWGDGAWNGEPDKIQWLDETTGFDCLIVRGPMGNLCGYVGVPPEHSCHGADYDDVKTANPDDNDYGSYVDVHGGLTFADSCDESAEEGRGICHIPLAGRPDDVWWLGFDCGHYQDISPGMEARSRERGLPEWRDSGSRYCTVAYVKREVEKLAIQLVTATVCVPDPLLEEGER